MRHYNKRIRFVHIFLSMFPCLGLAFTGTAAVVYNSMKSTAFISACGNAGRNTITTTQLQDNNSFGSEFFSDYDEEKIKREERRMALVRSLQDTFYNSVESDEDHSCSFTETEVYRNGTIKNLPLWRVNCECEIIFVFL